MSISINVSWSGQVDDDVVGEWLAPVPGQVDPLAADFVRWFLRSPRSGGLPGRRRRQQAVAGSPVPDARDVLVEER